MRIIKALPIMIISLCILYPLSANDIFGSFKKNNTSNKQSIKNAYKNRKSNIQVKGSGKVMRVLSDDKKGSKHQRFIIKLSSGHTLLIAHNIDIASRIPKLKLGRIVKFYGEYEWNSKGGVIHWTHHDPQKKHVDGWLKYQGKIYK